MLNLIKRVMKSIKEKNRIKRKNAQNKEVRDMLEAGPNQSMGGIKNYP